MHDRGTGESKIDSASLKRPRKTAKPKLANGLLTVIASLGMAGAHATSVWAEPISIPLQHVSSGLGKNGGDDAVVDENGDSDEAGYDTLGIMIGIAGADPRLFQFDTGSDEFNAQIDSDVPGVAPVPGTEPGVYAYGDGTYGYWLQLVQFDSLSYYDPDDPSEPLATFDGGYVAGQVLDWVYTSDNENFDELNVTQDPVGQYGDAPVYADLDVRQRIENGEPSDTPPFYGTLGGGDFISEGSETVAPGSHTQSGYVVSANANLGEDTTPGCAPCLTLNLSPNLRSQFTALTSWGNLDYDDYRGSFPRSGANASNEYEGAYSYTISFADDSGDERSVDLDGPILLDTGTSDFVFVTSQSVLNSLQSEGFQLDEYEIGDVDFNMRGFEDDADNMVFGGVDIYRQSNEDDSNGLVLGLPFFQLNSVMYDLENRTTAYSPFFVSADDFTTDVAAEDATQLKRATESVGSQGWLGLAGSIAGDGSFIIESGAIVRMTSANTYTGATYVESGGLLFLAGPGSIDKSSQVVVNGTLDISQKGNYLPQWAVSDAHDDAIIRGLSGAGNVQLGARRLVITNADDRFEGSITDYDDDGNNLGGRLQLADGRLTLSGDSDYSGVTEIAAGAELHLRGSLTSDISVSGLLVVEGEVFGEVTVEEGGRLAGSGTVGGVTVTEGGSADPINTSD